MIKCSRLMCTLNFAKMPETKANTLLCIIKPSVCVNTRHCSNSASIYCKELRTQDSKIISPHSVTKIRACE